MHRDTSNGPPKTANSSELLNKSMSNPSSSVCQNAEPGMQQRRYPSINQRENSLSTGAHSSHHHPNPSAKNRRRQKSVNRLNKSTDFSRHEGNNANQKGYGSYGAAKCSVDMNKSFGRITLQGNNDSVLTETPSVAPKAMNPAARYLASRRDYNTAQGASDSTISNKALGGVVSQKDNGFVVKSEQVGDVLDSAKMNDQHQSRQSRNVQGQKNSVNLNKSFGGFDRQPINTRHQQRLNRKLKRQQQKVSNPDISQELNQKVPAPEASATAKALTVGVLSENVPKTAVSYLHSNSFAKIGTNQGNGILLTKSSDHLGDYTDDGTQQKSLDSYAAPKCLVDMSKSFGGMTLQGNNGFHDQDGNSENGVDNGSKSVKNLNKSFGGYAANGANVCSKQQQRLNNKPKRQQQMASNQDTSQAVTQKEVPAPEASITSMAALTDNDSSEDISKTLAENVPVNLNWSLPPGNLYKAFEEEEEVYFNHTIGTIQYLDEVDERYRPDRYKFSVFATSIPSPGIEDDSDTAPESPAADSSGDPLIVDETIMEWNPVELMKKFNKPEFWKSSVEIEIPTVFGSDQEVKYVGNYITHRCTLPTMPVLYAKPNVCDFLHPETFELMNMPAGFLFNLNPTVPHQEGEVAAGLYYFVPKTDNILPDKWTLSNYPVNWLDPTLYNPRIKSKYAWELVMQQFLYPNGPVALEIAEHLPRSEAEGVVPVNLDSTPSKKTDNLILETPQIESGQKMSDLLSLQNSAIEGDSESNKMSSVKETRASSSADYSFPLPLGETPMVSLTNRVLLLGMTTRQFRIADRIGNPLPTKNGSKIPPTSPTVD
uniref:Tudor domain-containing protein n=1 Tax=Caenorhabditis tropicalis TaxID=1561998 RepID=A0A1I7U2Y1_9PELO